MAIPAFAYTNVLPPHKGDPTSADDLSPYPCTILELCQSMGGSPQRKQILQGLLDWRAFLRRLGFIQGFQWLDGSFVENIEVLEKRPPNDFDIVTFYAGIDATQMAGIAAANPILVDWDATKNQYHLDHYFVDVTDRDFALVEDTRYWSLLFSHRRDGVWKGMLRIELDTPTDDAAALAWLNPPPAIP